MLWPWYSSNFLHLCNLYYLFFSGLRGSSAGLVQTSAYQEFFSLTAEDEGLYICRAQSSAGTEEKRIQLVVDTLPSRGDITGEYISPFGLYVYRVFINWIPYTI